MANVVDLSHSLDRNTLVWPGDPPFRRDSHAVLARDGFELGTIAFGEHTGTHVGVAAHMRAGGATLDALPSDLLVLPFAVVDVRDRVVREPDYRVTLGDLLAWETRHGAFPANGAVLILTGWSARWHDAAAYFNVDAAGVAHTPGLALDAAQWLASSRSTVALGIDAPGIDAGPDTGFSVNRFWLDGRRYHIENLTNLERVPPRGATLFVGALPVVGGTGSPARVLALVNEDGG